MLNVCNNTMPELDLICNISVLAVSAQAQDWKAKYPELIFATIPAENAAQVTERYKDFGAYLSKEIGDTDHIEDWYNKKCTTNQVRRRVRLIFTVDSITKCKSFVAIMNFNFILLIL